MLLRALSEQQTSVHQAVECRVEFDLPLVHHCSQLLRTCKNVTQLVAGYLQQAGERGISSVRSVLFPPEIV